MTRLHLLIYIFATTILCSCAGKVKPPDMVVADEWGSQPEPIPESRRQLPTVITLHHAGVVWNEGDDPREKITTLQSWGKTDKGWPDLPYHFLVAPDGRIFEGRPVLYEGETNTDYPLQGHIGINVWGNFEEQRISIEQLRAVVDLCAWLCQKYKIDPGTIEGHRDAAPGQTVCPGKDFYRYIERGVIQTWVREKLDGNNPDIILIKELADGPTDIIPGGTRGRIIE